MINNNKPLSRRLSIAPMMDITNRHFRYLLRLISPHCLLYSEMITSGAVIHGDREHVLGFSVAEHPLALQLGGSDPQALAESAKIAAQFNYDEINLNVGCPSDRVQKGRFGACLLKEPNLVAECISAMQQVVSVPVTVKTRIGVDDLDSYDHLCDFIGKIAAQGCQTFIVHARKAWLKGLSPKQNRDIPPLDYARVYQLKQDFPALEIIINGGIDNLAAIQEHLQHVDGVMLGRHIVNDPYALADYEAVLFNHTPVSRFEIIKHYFHYAAAQFTQGEPRALLIKPLFGLYQGCYGGKVWRRYLSEHLAQVKNSVDWVYDLLLKFESEYVMINRG